MRIDVGGQNRGIVANPDPVGEEVVQPFKDKLELKYFWRPNDLCPARSRNIGAKEAPTQYLVYLDGDMLLNPAGLAAYQKLFERFPEHIWAGYFGSIKDYSAASLFLPPLASLPSLIA